MLLVQGQTTERTSPFLLVLLLVLLLPPPDRDREPKVRGGEGRL